MSISLRQSLAEILEDLKNDIDVPTFEQILEMDDDEDREFSRALVFEFLYQAKDTFQKIEGSLYVASTPRSPVLPSATSHSVPHVISEDTLFTFTAGSISGSPYLPRAAVYFRTVTSPTFSY